MLSQIACGEKISLRQTASDEECTAIIAAHAPKSGEGGGDKSPLLPDLAMSINQTQAQENQGGLSIGGIITGTLRRGIYHVSEDLVVPAGQTLFIEDDTYLSFSPDRQMIVAGQLTTGGRLPVSFLSENPELGWGGLHFLPSSQGSQCVKCKLEYIKPGGVAIRVEAPITFKEGQIVSVKGGTAISSTVPFTLSNVVIDYVQIALYLSGTPTTTQKATHLTLFRCLQGIVNHNQQVSLDNSIIASCVYPITTELSGTTIISYSLLYNYSRNITVPGAQLVQGIGMLRDVDPGFVNPPYNYILRTDSPAINVANPDADYSVEPGFNGERADMGAYGNTGYATQVPPLNQMGVSIWAVTPNQVGQLGQIVTFTIKIKNTGAVTDVYYISIDEYRSDLSRYSRLFKDGYKGPDLVELAPQAETTRIVWVEIPANFNSLSNTVHIDVFNGFGIHDTLNLTIQVPSFQEKSGQVIMEAERFAVVQTNQNNHVWLPQTTLSGYIGAGYISALPDTDIQFTTIYTANNPALHHTINFTTTGVYHVWLRGYAPNGAGDSLYMTLDDQPTKTVTGFAPGAWTWADDDFQSGRAIIEVTEPGLHILHLWQREDGLRLDRIVLTTNSVYNPTGDGPPESEIR